MIDNLNLRNGTTNQSVYERPPYKSFSQTESTNYVRRKRPHRMRAYVWLLALGFLLVCAFAVHAGTLTITITNDATAVVGTRTYNINNANFGRILAVMKLRYGQVPSGPADPVTGIVPMRDRTNGEAIQAWLDGFWQGTRDGVAGDEKAAAATTAAGAVGTIP